MDSGQAFQRETTSDQNNLDFNFSILPSGYHYSKLPVRLTSITVARVGTEQSGEMQSRPCQGWAGGANQCTA